MTRDNLVTASLDVSLEEAKDTGADMVVTSCPWCETNLRAGGIGMAEKMEIVDIFDLMMEAL